MEDSLGNTSVCSKYLVSITYRQLHRLDLLPHVRAMKERSVHTQSLEGAGHPEPLVYIPAAKPKIKALYSVRVLKISTQCEYYSSHQGSEGGQSSTLVLGNCICISWIHGEFGIFLTF